jgi:hypothetical protein
MSRPAVTLPEELMLLALDPVSGKPRVRARHLQYGLAGAVLAELEAVGCVAEDGGRVVPVTPPPTGERLLDEALALFGGGKPVKTRRWIRSNGGTVAEACAGRLAERGVIRIESRRVLGIFPGRRYPQAGADQATPAVTDFRGAAKMGFPEPRSRMLAGLASAIMLTGHLLPESGSKREIRRTMRGLARELWPAEAVYRLIKSDQAAAAAGG